MGHKSNYKIKTCLARDRKVAVTAGSGEPAVTARNLLGCNSQFQPGGTSLHPCLDDLVPDVSQPVVSGVSLTPGSAKLAVEVESPPRHGRFGRTGRDGA